MSSQSEVTETTVGNVAIALVRKDLDPHDRVTITIEPDEPIPGRRGARARVIAAGLSDEDIARMINRRNRRSSRALEGAGLQPKRSPSPPPGRYREQAEPGEAIHRQLSSLLRKRDGQIQS